MVPRNSRSQVPRQILQAPGDVGERVESQTPACLDGLAGRAIIALSTAGLRAAAQAQSESVAELPAGNKCRGFL